MVRFYKIIKLAIAVITTSNAIASKPTSPTHTTKEQHRNIATTCHPRWRTTQGENATNRIIRRRVELIASNTSLKRPITKQTTKDHHDKDITQQPHQQMTQEEERNTTKEKNTATQLCNTETKKLPRMVPRKKPPRHDKRNTTQQSRRTLIGK